jgi:hypothetical protein
MEKSELKKIIDDYKNSSNKELITVMDYLNEEFTTTKKAIIESTYYLDNVEKTYNLLLKEYQSRQNGSR